MIFGSPAGLALILVVGAVWIWAEWTVAKAGRFEPGGR